MVKAILIKPLDGDPEGTVREFDKPDFDRLIGYGAVRLADGDELRSDGPTVAEWVAAGYPAKTYPPTGYVSRSTADEIAAAIAAQDATVPNPGDGVDTVAGGEKSDPPVENKAAPKVANKAAPVPSNKAAD